MASRGGMILLKSFFPPAIQQAGASVVTGPVGETFSFTRPSVEKVMGIRIIMVKAAMAEARAIRATKAEANATQRRRRREKAAAHLITAVKAAANLITAVKAAANLIMARARIPARAEPVVIAMARPLQ